MEDRLGSTQHHMLYIPALGVVNIISATSVIVLPNTLNVVLTVTV